MKLYPKNQNWFHWSSVKKFSCLKIIDFILEAGLKFWPIYMKSILCSSPQTIKLFNIRLKIDAIYHDSSLNRKRM